MLCDGLAEEELINERKQELDESIKQMQFLRKKLEELNKQQIQIAKQKIERCLFKGGSCLFIKENVELENLGMSVGKLYEQEIMGTGKVYDYFFD